MFMGTVGPLYFWAFQHTSLEIDRYIDLPIFFPIFKHFTIIGYRFCNIGFFFFFFFFFKFFFFSINAAILWVF